MTPRVGSLWRYREWGIVYVVTLAHDGGPYRLEAFDATAVSFIRENLAELLSDFEPIAEGADLDEWREVLA